MNHDEKQLLISRAQVLLSEQNFLAAVVAGVAATILAAFAYAIVTSQWPFSSGFAAVGIGIAVGAAMQYLGRGIETRFAIAAAVFTSVGCLFGNALRETMFGIDGNLFIRLSAVRDVQVSALFEQGISYAASFNLVFWLIAIWFAAFLVKRPLSRRDRLALGALERGDPS